MSIGLSLAAAGIYVAAVIAAWGMLALFLDRDVIAEPGVPVILVPGVTVLMALGVAVAVFLLIARRWPARSVLSRWGYGCLVGVGAVVGWPLALLVGAFLSGESLAAASSFVLHQSLAPFLWAQAAIAAITTTLLLAWVGYYDPDRPAPRWYWESREDSE